LTLPTRNRGEKVYRNEQKLKAIHYLCIDQTENTINASKLHRKLLEGQRK